MLLFFKKSYHYAKRGTKFVPLTRLQNACQNISLSLSDCCHFPECFETIPYPTHTYIYYVYIP